MIEKKSIFKSIFEKPWEQSQALKDNNHDGKALSITASKLGVRYIMVVSTVIISLFIVSYSDRMLVHDWKIMPEPWLLWVNTVILVLNSYFFHKTKIAADNIDYTKIKKGLTPSCISFDHSKACIPTKVRPPKAVANINHPHIFLFLS